MEKAIQVFFNPRAPAPDCVSRATKSLLSRLDLRDEVFSLITAPTSGLPAAVRSMLRLPELLSTVYSDLVLRFVHVRKREFKRVISANCKLLKAEEALRRRLKNGGSKDAWKGAGLTLTVDLVQQQGCTGIHSTLHAMRLLHSDKCLGKFTTAQLLALISSYEEDGQLPAGVNSGTGKEGLVAALAERVSQQGKPPLYVSRLLAAASGGMSAADLRQPVTYWPREQLLAAGSAGVAASLHSELSRALQARGLDAMCRWPSAAVSALLSLYQPGSANLGEASTVAAAASSAVLGAAAPPVDDAAATALVHELLEAGRGVRACGAKRKRAGDDAGRLVRGGRGGRKGRGRGRGRGRGWADADCSDSGSSSTEDGDDMVRMRAAAEAGAAGADDDLWDGRDLEEGHRRGGWRGGRRGGMGGCGRGRGRSMGEA